MLFSKYLIVLFDAGKQHTNSSRKCITCDISRPMHIPAVISSACVIMRVITANSLRNCIYPSLVNNSTHNIYEHVAATRRFSFQNTILIAYGLLPATKMIISVKWGLVWMCISLFWVICDRQVKPGLYQCQESVNTGLVT